MGVAVAASAKSLQSCLTLCDPIDGSPPGSCKSTGMGCHCLLKMGVEICQRLFSASIEIIIWFLSFNLLMWCITLIDLHILKKPCITGINPT